MGQRTIDLSRVEILVLDEADRMLDMGFIRDIRKVLAVLPAKRQNLLFSATFSDEIRRLAGDFLDRPAQVQVTPRNTATELVTQVVHPVDRERKRELLSFLITSGRIDQALVFTRTKHGANRLALQLEKDGIKATAIHGNKSQPQRVRALADFKAGRYAVLVATEIAARGLDIDALPHVVNFELPMVPEDYVHRIGRTGRAEKDGDAVSLVCVDEMKLLAEIEKVLGRRIPTEVIPGFEPDPRIRPEPILRGGLGTSRPQSSGPRNRGGSHAPRQGMATRSDHGSPAGAGAGRGGASRGGGYAAPRRPGQGLGNGVQPHAGGGRPAQPHVHASRPAGGQGRPAQGPGGARSGGGRPGSRPGNGYGPGPSTGHSPRPASGHGRPNPSNGYGNQRPAGPGTVMPGERIARSGNR
jgi:ATP-dependent RNA helicase RhlE